jgi:quercetin 2,3-dioxygenase
MEPKGPAQTFTPINLWDLELWSGKSVKLSLPDGHTTAFLCLSGSVVANDDQDVSEGDLAIFSRAGDSIILEAKSDTELLLLDGEPIDEPIVGQGPFVMNTRDEILAAFRDYQLGKMGDLD